MTALSGSYSTSPPGSLARERVTDNTVQYETQRRKYEPATLFHINPPCGIHYISPSTSIGVFEGFICSLCYKIPNRIMGIGVQGPLALGDKRDIPGKEMSARGLVSLSRTGQVENQEEVETFGLPNQIHKQTGRRRGGTGLSHDTRATEHLQRGYIFLFFNIFFDIPESEVAFRSDSEARNSPRRLGERDPSWLFSLFLFLVAPAWVAPLLIEAGTCHVAQICSRS
jgi:hypothetical protein